MITFLICSTYLQN